MTEPDSNSKLPPLVGLLFLGCLIAIPFVDPTRAVALAVVILAVVVDHIGEQH